MTREEQIRELTILTCDMYCRNKEKKCAGIQECDMKCLQYNRCENVYDNWHYCKQIEAEWIPIDVYYSPMNCYVVQGYHCSNCKTKFDSYSNYCPHCGAIMSIKGDKINNGSV